MDNAALERFNNTLKHIYINPLEACNLRCALCYTKKTGDVLSESQIKEFITRYTSAVQLETVTLCGGEVFLLPYLPQLVNWLSEQSIFTQIITNGTVGSLNQFTNPNAINLIVSIDGEEKDHDKNRGGGNFQKSLSFLRQANGLGFHTEIFTIITKNTLHAVDHFQSLMNHLLGYTIPITLHPRKPQAYLSRHPISNKGQGAQGFGFLTPKETKDLMANKKTFPPLSLGCYQISLYSTGLVYGCCESTRPIGAIIDDPVNLINTLKKQIVENVPPNTLGCCDPKFLCGLQEVYDIQ